MPMMDPYGSERTVQVAPHLSSTHLPVIARATSQEASAPGFDIPSEVSTHDGDSDPADSDDPHNALISQTLNPDGTPKRPMNAFLLFARRRRPEISAENAAMRTGEVSKILSKEWTAMPAEKKQFYQEQAKRLKDKFNHNYPDYVYTRRPNHSRKRRRAGSDRRGSPPLLPNMGSSSGAPSLNGYDAESLVDSAESGSPPTDVHDFEAGYYAVPAATASGHRPASLPSYERSAQAMSYHSPDPYALRGGGGGGGSSAYNAHAGPSSAGSSSSSYILSAPSGYGGVYAEQLAHAQQAHSQQQQQQQHQHQHSPHDERGGGGSAPASAGWGTAAAQPGSLPLGTRYARAHSLSSPATSAHGGGGVGQPPQHHPHHPAAQSHHAHAYTTAGVPHRPWSAGGVSPPGGGGLGDAGLGALTAPYYPAATTAQQQQQTVDRYTPSFTPPLQVKSEVEPPAPARVQFELFGTAHHHHESNGSAAAAAGNSAYVLPSPAPGQYPRGTMERVLPPLTSPGAFGAIPSVGNMGASSSHLGYWDRERTQ